MEDIYLKNDKILLIIIVIVIICIIAVIGLILSINKKDTTTIIEEDEIANLQEGGAEYTTDELKTFEIKINNLDNNVKNKIKDYNKFILAMKEYIYKNGLVQADTAEYIGIKEEESKIIIRFKLNNANGTILSATIDLRDNSYKFSDNY